MKIGLFLSLLLFAGDALAWGLQTHLFLAQQALPAVSPGCAALVFAGACLPDLALAGRFLGTPAFRRAHLWSTLRRLAAAPRSEEEHALAVGYASHLLADVVAHNAFVPEHEARIARIPHFTHALAEWAMDQHLHLRVPVEPREALLDRHAAVVLFVSRHFGCGEALAAHATAWLAAADGWLRASPVPRLCLSLLGSRRFDDYLRRASDSLSNLEAALEGRLVDWVSSDPEGRGGNAAADRRASEHIARIV
ncbi:MAG TPA: zinc dependent phospholipase C family protein [Burkholderiales bacterium]